MGVRDSTLSLKLQLKEKLTLEEAVAQTREAEMIKSKLGVNTYAMIAQFAQVAELELAI